jgi:hypothetical protein
MFNKAFAAVAGAALLLAVPTAGANAATSKTGVNVGSLSCTVEGGVGMILGSSKHMTCTYKPNKGKSQKYSGTIDKLGVDVGVTGKTYIAWLVFAPGNLKAGALQGTYAGVTASASVGVGLGANVLVGGSKNSIALQPVSVQGQTGVNIAGGLTQIKLKYGK